MADMWTPPADATSEQFPNGRNPLDGSARLAALLAEFKTLIGDMPGHLLANAGIAITTGGMVIDSELRVTGNTRIEGTLDLPAGIIGNDDLAHQISAADIPTQDVTGWSNAAGGGGTVQASVTLTAPAGYALGIVSANMYVQATHTGGADYLRIYPEIGGAQGRPGGTYVNAGSGDQANVSYTRIVAATSIVVAARIFSTWAVPANAGNIANITGQVTWLR